ncbi:hypothetical protein BFR40_07260 [Brochothrix thermosphacta]|uniref:hypothetical protein n=1 Tax=Brochothrix thermosphacta TaxID=2756 RepID=UPI00083FD388|nr:hypothetical protein [Brochothrix thermosphacta]ODJ51790.1 hypothetical protein BFR40_07260 [Brochothrix thermosphacta]
MKKITEVDYSELYDLGILTNEVVEALGVLDSLFQVNRDANRTVNEAVLVLSEVEHLAPVYMVVMRVLKQQTKDMQTIIEKYELQNEQ